MSITKKYFDLKAENAKLTKLLSFICEQIELGDDANLDCAEAKEFWAWWDAHKQREKK